MCIRDSIKKLKALVIHRFLCLDPPLDSRSRATHNSPAQTRFFNTDYITISLARRGVHKVFYKQQQLTEQQHKYNQLDACFFKTIPYFHKNETCRVLHTAHYICYFADLKIRFFFFFFAKS